MFKLVKPTYGLERQYNDYIGERTGSQSKDIGFKLTNFKRYWIYYLGGWLLKQRSVQFWVVGVVFMMGVCMLFLFNWPLNKMIKYTLPLDKATAQLFADKRVKSEFVGAKLVRSSESIENKVGLNGWVFIYESNGVFGWNHHSAAIMVDINTAETLIQRAY